ncbi:hypothetical protein ACEWY4_026440 [Coilia grayii]|uniref:ZP domain-containing protein n=1 Tax=Coilia grayii TaxID=363190 RepID=A0ABD1IUV6_9TELE
MTLQPEDVRIGDSTCEVTANDTHLLATIALGDCGTIMEDDGVYLIFSNEIVSYNDTSAIVVREPLVDVEFSCRYLKQQNLTVGFLGHRPPVNFTQKGFGTFTMKFEFYDSDDFTTAKDPMNYPLEFDLGEMMYMQIESFSSIPNTALFAESCKATPTDNPHDSRVYPIISNGCEVDPTVTIYSNQDFPAVQFSMQAFKFIGLHDQVFITCSVILCKSGVASSSCSTGCIPRVRREASKQGDGADYATMLEHSSGSETHTLASDGHLTSYWQHRVSKRDAPVQTSSHFISQGPLRLRQAGDIGVNEVEVARELDPNMMLTVACVLAVTAMACGAALYRTRSQRVPYQSMAP